MTKKMSGAHALYTHLKTLKDGTIFTTAYINRTLSDYPSGGISGELHRLKQVGALSQGGHKQEYIVHANKLANYGAGKRWKGAYITRGTGKTAMAKKGLKVTKQHAQPLLETDTLFKSTSDADVLGNLLDAMAQAEHVIRKYQRIIDALDDLGLKGG